jgi:hypothetical protein
MKAAIPSLGADGRQFAAREKAAACIERTSPDAAGWKFHSDRIGTEAPACFFDAFSSREPAPTWLENAPDHFI